MANWTKWVFGGLCWTIGGPIGAIIGFALGTMIGETVQQTRIGSGTQPGDFGAALLVLCAAVMKSDNRILRAELDFIKQFFVRQFGVEHAKERILLLREILKQDYSLQDVCSQIKRNLDAASKLQLIHLLFGLSGADGEVHPKEVEIIEDIANYLGIGQRDFDSIKAMFAKDTTSAYKILEVDPTATNEEIKKAYRAMAVKHHPDKVHHLGPDFQKAAQEKFKTINEAYEQIKKERGIV